MSDEESNRSLSEEEDLFGEAEEEQPTSIPSDVENEDSDDDKTARILDITLPRHAVSHKPEGDTYTIKMPVFLNVEAHPFDPTDFKERVAQNALERNKSELDDKQIQNDLIAEKLLNENTIRWRYSNSGNDEIIKQSNAHFVQWDDGLMSVKIGNELFDFKDTPLFDNYLARSYVEHEVLQNDAIITKSANLLPSSTFTDTHRRLTQAVKNIQKRTTILNTLTEKDPMLKQKMADEDERKSLKMRRQIETKRRLQEERLGKSESPAPSRGSGNMESAYERFERTYAADEYDEEDDFIADDDEELEVDDDDDDNHLDDAANEEEAFEKGAERLKNLKNEGASKYKASTPDDGEDRKKRRRIIDSDDEE